jgi:inorganic pyrophosphatase
MAVQNKAKQIKHLMVISFLMVFTAVSFSALVGCKPATSLTIMETPAGAEVLPAGVTLSVTANDVYEDYKFDYSIGSSTNYYNGYEATNADGTMNAIIEIPAGTNAKWETDIVTGKIGWEIKNNKHRMIAFLGYPGNYGMIPKTKGGDGDPLDVLVIGSPLLRGSVNAVRLIGALLILDGTDPDDKLIAVTTDGVFKDVNSLADLDAQFPEAKEGIKSWFENYKGPGEMTFQSWADASQALVILNTAKAAYTP